MRNNRSYNTLAWPQNSGNSISEDLNLRHFAGEDSPPIDPSTGDRLRRSVSRIPFSKIMYPPQGMQSLPAFTCLSTADGCRIRHHPFLFSVSLGDFQRNIRGIQSFRKFQFHFPLDSQALGDNRHSLVSKFEFLE